jgi:glycosyltransferase involved in cell wall biosynthesis
MKVFVLGTRGFPGIQGGIEKHCAELYPRLNALGCRVTVLTRTGYMPKHRRVSKKNGIRFCHVWAPRNRYFETLIHTFLGIIIARLHSPDIVHIHAIGPCLLVPLARVLGLKVVMTHHGPDYKRAKWKRFAKLILRTGEFVGIWFSNHVISVSRTVGIRLGQKYPKARIRYIPNGVALPTKHIDKTILARFGIEPHKYILTACRFVPEKGLHDLIAAYESLKKPGFKLVIAGDADHETGYSRKLKESARKNTNIILTGSLGHQQLSTFYAHAKLFVLASYYEGLPIALLEALSHSLPVLVSDIEATREIPLPEYRYFPVHDINTMAEKILELTKQPLVREEVRSSIRLVRDQYDWQKIAEQTRAVYEQVDRQRSRHLAY